jgi:malate dehydrogenase (oxaloacetate-decarboxylating)(NADP+)
MVQRGGADAMLCGTVGRFNQHLKHVDDIIGKANGIQSYSTLTGLILPSGTFFICDTHVTPDPTAEEIAEMTRLAAEEVRCFGIVPKVALLSRSNFGTSDTPSALKMREALRILSDVAPELEVDGEMHALRIHTQGGASGLASQRSSKSSGNAERGCRQHCL